MSANACLMEPNIKPRRFNVLLTCCTGFDQVFVGLSVPEIGAYIITQF